jgi:hypothetical protein
MRLFIPDKIDIDNVLSEFPPDGIKDFNRDKLVYIISLIISIPAGNNDLQISNGFVPINAKILQNSVRNYKDYFKYLCERGIIETDNWYIPSIKSTGYKFPFYWRRLKAVEIKSRSVISAIRQENKWDPETKAKYSHLLKWWNDKINVDYEIALDFLDADLAIKRKANDFLDRDRRTGEFKNPWQQYWNNLISIERLASKEYLLSVDQSGGRFHSPLTNIRGMLRNCISYDDKTLVSIDLKNSQPFLSNILLSPSFWNGDDETPNSLKLNNFFPINDEILNISSSVKTCIHSEEKALNDDRQLYIKLVQDGTFYEFMAIELFNRLGMSFNNRQDLKGTILLVLYSGNGYFNQPEAAPKRVFAELFPTVYKIFAAIKEGNKARLPILLQRIESKLILDIITRRIDREDSSIPLFTIHDSIVTTLGNDEFVTKILCEEMTSAIGFAPKISVEEWIPENLKYKDGEYYDITPLENKLALQRSL